MWTSTTFLYACMFLWKIYVSDVSWIRFFSYLLSLDYIVGIVELCDIHWCEISQVWSVEIVLGPCEYVDLYEEKEIPPCIMQNYEMCAKLVLGIVFTSQQCIDVFENGVNVFSFSTCYGWSTSVEL